MTPDVLARSVDGIYGTGTHCELIHVSLADQDGSGPLQSIVDSSVVSGKEVAQHSRGARRPDAISAVIILQGDWNAVQRRKGFVFGVTFVGV